MHCMFTHELDSTRAL